MSACVCARVPSNIALKQISFSHVVTFNKYRCPSCKRALRSPRLATMKERASSAKKDRTYDADGYTQRAGCLCFKTDSEKEVLLVTSNRFPDKWIVPSGGVEAGEEFQDAAVREVLEEAGVQGKIVRSLGMFQHDINRTRTMLYVLIVNKELEVWQDAAQVGRERGWFPIHEAWTLLSHRPHQQSYLLQVMNSKSKSDQLRPIQQSYWTSQNRQQNRVLCKPHP